MMALRLASGWQVRRVRRRCCAGWGGVGRGWGEEGRWGMGWVSWLVGVGIPVSGMRAPIHCNRLQCSACCGEAMLSQEGIGNNDGMVKHQGRCITVRHMNYCANDKEVW